MSSKYVTITNKKVKNKKAYTKIIQSLDQYQKKIKFYTGLKKSDGREYINNVTKTTSIFINNCKFNDYRSKYSNYHFLTINSLNPCLSTKLVINNLDQRIQYIEQYFYYNPSYTFNPTGPIIIYVNNFIMGYFIHHWKKTNELLEFQSNRIATKYARILTNLYYLIIEIRKYNQTNPIKIRFSPKNKNLIRALMAALNEKLPNLNLEVDQSKYNDLIQECYCVFVQNAKIILELANAGVPLFSPNLIECDYFDGIYLDLPHLKDLSENQESFPDRKKFLLKYYPHIIFVHEYQDNVGYISELIISSIN